MQQSYFAFLSEKKMRKNYFIFLSFPFVISTLAFSKSQVTPTSPPSLSSEVVVTDAKKRIWYDDIRTVGRVECLNKKHIYTPFSGTVLKSFVEVGDQIKKDSPLVLIKQEQAGHSFKTHLIKSRYSGTILNKNFELGKYLTSYSELLSLSDFKHMGVKINLTPEDSSYISRGEEVSVYAQQQDKDEQKAFVRSISPIIKKEIGTIEITLEFKPSKKRLLPGSFVWVNLKIRKRHNISLPKKALYKDHFVWVVGKTNKVTQKEVKTGLQKKSFVEIISGLNPRERVVISHKNSLRDGELVSIKKTNL
jgi:multidrug efflux pump subunit AcrA (membrane-fusion protein)